MKTNTSTTNHCVDCGTLIKRSSKRCIPCFNIVRKAKVWICVDCGVATGRELKYCKSCYEKFRMARVWTCVDCGIVVERKRRRCATCHKANLPKRASYERTPEHVDKMRQVTSKPRPHLQGRKHSDEVKAKMASAWTDEKKQAARKRIEKLKQCPEWLLKMSLANSGSNNPMWRGGMTGQKYAPGFCKTLKERIRKRDNFTCQLCGVTEEQTGYNLSIHHSDYDKSNHSECNLFATCKACNSRVNANRNKWTQYFKDKAARRGLL